MLIIPIRTQNYHEEKCPKCGKTEDIISVCRHCGYEYEDSYGIMFYLSAVIATVIFLWVFITLSTWILFNFDKLSLFQILANQWKWLTSLKVK